MNSSMRNKIALTMFFILFLPQFVASIFFAAACLIGVWRDFSHFYSCNFYRTIVLFSDKVGRIPVIACSNRSSAARIVKGIYGNGSGKLLKWVLRRHLRVQRVPFQNATILAKTYKIYSKFTFKIELKSSSSLGLSRLRPYCPY